MWKEGKEEEMRKNPITLRLKSVFTLKDVVKAVEDLISYYENPRADRYDGIKCPLCRLFFDCKYCLWAIFHHMECDDLAEKRFGTDAAVLKKDVRWRAFRVKELKHWLKELKRPGVKVIKGG